MKISIRLLSFQQVADHLNVSLEVVRALVVEEKRLPALYVTLVGYPAKYEYQLIDTDPEGNACDLSVLTKKQYQDGVRTRTGYLRVERDALERFTKEECFDDSPSAAISSKEHPTKPAPDTVTPAPVGAASDGPKPLSAEHNWKMRIQAAATEHCLAMRKSGCSPTKSSIVETMARWCRHNHVMTDGKIFPSAAYLRTHVLGGSHWDLPK